MVLTQRFTLIFLQYSNQLKYFMLFRHSNYFAIDVKFWKCFHFSLPYDDNGRIPQRKKSGWFLPRATKQIIGVLFLLPENAWVFGPNSLPGPLRIWLKRFHEIIFLVEKNRSSLYIRGEIKIKWDSVDIFSPRIVTRFYDKIIIKHKLKRECAINN